MSVHDLVESDCGGSNSLIKLSSHFVQDHAFKEQNLKLPVQSQSNEQQFLDATTGEVNYNITIIDGSLILFVHMRVCIFLVGGPIF